MASPSGQASNLSTIPLHPRFDQKDCPTCGQEIPPEKLEEIGGRIAAKEREQTLEITALLEKRYASEKARAEAIRGIQKAKADLENQINLIIGTSSNDAAA
jgi:DNA repair exonuclease SbcCD ATPase subunit